MEKSASGRRCGLATACADVGQNNVNQIRQDIRTKAETIRLSLPATE